MNKYIRVFLSWLTSVEWNPVVIIVPFLTTCFVSITYAMYWLFVDILVEAVLIAFISITIITTIALITNKIAASVPGTIHPFDDYKKRKWHRVEIPSDTKKDMIIEWWIENGNGLISRGWNSISFSDKEDATYVMLRWGGDDG